MDISGHKFSRLTAIKIVGKNKSRNLLWECVCDCGNISIVSGQSLIRGHTRSCGCIQKEHAATARPITHGETINNKRTAEYRCWSKMKGRCLNPNGKRYKDYGGRGIKVCDRWIESFENFLEDMGRKPSPKHSLDRLENEGNYEKSNCAWRTEKEQNRNRRSNVFVEYGGSKMILKDFTSLLGFDYKLFHQHLRKKKDFDSVLEYFMNKKIAS